MKRVMNITFASKIDKIENINSSFDAGVLRICYTGKNPNNSFIAKDTIERAVPSMYNCPIVCNYIRETDSLGAHDAEVVKSDDGMRFVNVTQPVGVIPESGQWWWEEIEDSGGIHEYLCADVILWKRQEAYRKIKEDGITDESMEININQGGMKDGVYVIDDFEFTAFCLLGSAPPCFESASLHLFSKDDFNAQFSQMIKEIKETFAASEKEVSESENTEKGEEVLEDEIKIPEFETQSAPQAVPEQNFELSGQIKDQLIRSVEAETITTAWGETSKYWYHDHDEEKHEVYAMEMPEYLLCGFPYSLSGDKVDINFACKKKKKFAIVDFVDGEEQPMLYSRFEEMATNKLNDANGEWQEKYAAKEKECNELLEFKALAETESRKAEQEKVFAEFSDLAGVAAFEQLREKCLEFSKEDLEEKCYAIRGRQKTEMKFSAAKDNAPAKLPVEPTTPIVNNEPYGGIFAQYGITE